MGKKSKKANPYGFKSHFEAINKADKNTPISIDTLRELQAMHNYPITTKEDFRFFVLMNHIRAIVRRLDDSKEASFLNRIQDNILLSAEKFLK